MNFNGAAIASIKGSDYRIQFWYMSKYDAINIMNSSNLNEKSNYHVFSLYIKMSEKTYYERNRETLLNKKYNCSGPSAFKSQRANQLSV